MWWGFETHGRHYQKSKIGVSVAPQIELMSSKKYEINHKQLKLIVHEIMS